jgi:hypothetical protein
VTETASAANREDPCAIGSTHSSAVIYVAVGFALDVLNQAMAPALEAANFALTAVFLGRVRQPVRRIARQTPIPPRPWIDLVALIPVTRGVRMARLGRLLRLVRVFAGVFRALDHLTALANHRGLALIVVS